MPRYEFRLLKPDGAISFQYSQFCVNQEEANRVARRLWASRPESDRIEIWLGRDCYYRGRPTQWPFTPAKRGDLQQHEPGTNLAPTAALRSSAGIGDELDRASELRGAAPAPA
jgi:hypothetical protein